MLDHIKALRKRLDAGQNPYFVALRDGTFEQADFLETQVQFLQAVQCFPRNMLLLASRCEIAEQRTALVEHVADETGRGDPSQTHERIFRSLLERLGADANSVASRPIWPEIRAFNGALRSTCAGQPPLLGIAMLGMIEDLFADVSEWIGRSIVRLGWLEEREVVHYALHETMGTHHAKGFYDLLEAPFAEDPVAAQTIRDGLELGGYLLCRLYADLFSARSRRWTL